MSRSGYSDDCENVGLWRGAVSSAIRGKRGQAFLKEMLAALNTMPVKRLVTGELETNGEVCAIGAVGRARSIDMSHIDPEDGDTVAATFGISRVLALEIVYMNDEAFDNYWCKTPEARFEKMREWVLDNIKGLPRRHGWTKRYHAARKELEALK